MSITFTEEFFKEEVLEEGTYEAEFRSYRQEEDVETSYGIRDRAVLDFIVEGHLLVEKCTIHSNSKRLKKFAKGMNGGTLAGGFMFEDHIGETFIVEVKHNEDDNGRLWVNIEEIRTM